MVTETETETGFVDARGARFAYTSEGHGPVALNAHGLTSSRANDAASGLATYSSVADAGFRVISYDARGHGETGGTRSSELYSWSALADDMLALADHFSPETPVSAIGCSMGTGTLLHAVTRAPERFERIVLTAPPTAWETRADQADAYRSLADFVESSTPEGAARLMAAEAGPPIFADAPTPPPVPDISFELMPTVFRGAALADFPPLDEIRRLTLPTLVLAWATDPGHPVSTAEALHEAVARSELHVSSTRADIGTWGDRAARFLLG